MKEKKRMKLFLMQATHDSPTGRKVCRHKQYSVIAFIQTSSLVKGNLDSRVREIFACESHQRLKSGIPVPLTKYSNFSTCTWNLESTAWSPESRIVFDSLTLGEKTLFKLALGNQNLM